MQSQHDKWLQQTKTEQARAHKESLYNQEPYVRKKERKRAEKAKQDRK